MSDQPPSAPPAYGTVINEQPGAGYAPPPAGFNPPYPPTGPGQEPPPKYEAPKEGPYAQQPQQPPQGGYFPNQAGYNQPGNYPTDQGYQAAQVHQTVVITDLTSYGPGPRVLQCPSCQATVTTRISHTVGGLTWLTAGLICLFGCWLGCCMIPFCVPDLQDVEHRCPNCGKHIGTYTRL